MRNLIFALVFVQFACSQQSQNDDVRPYIYKDLIEKINSEFQNKTNVYFNLKSDLEIPIKFSSKGTVAPILYETERLKDTLLVKDLRNDKSLDAIKMYNFDYISELKQVAPLKSEKVLINIHNPIDFWLDYYFKTFTNSKNYNDVFIPVEIITIKNNSSEKSMKVYKYDPSKLKLVSILDECKDVD